MRAIILTVVVFILFLPLSRFSFVNTMLLRMLSIILILLVFSAAASASNVWNGWSPNNNNDRYRRDPLPVTLPANKTNFEQLWYTKLDGPVAMTPTVYENFVYVSTMSGSFYCLNAKDGNIVWQKNFSRIMKNGYNYFSRSSPLIYKRSIIVGIMEGSLFKPVPGHGSYIIALGRSTGALRWKTRVATHLASSITATPQLAKDRLFVGITSGEEAFAVDPTYPCCSFQGAVVALNARTGKFLWETKMVPDNNGSTGGYSGAAVWGSQFPVDHKRNQIYVATGNYYEVPESIQKCLDETSNQTVYSDPCIEKGAYGDSILALDMDTGLIRWSRILQPVDAWTGACVYSPPGQNANCPAKPGPDYDFAQAPILKVNHKYKFGGKNRDQLFIGQKSGIAFGLDAETGTVTWSNQISPGAALGGGIQFGSAADDQNLYVASNNADGLSYVLPDGRTTRKASWSALDLVTGNVKWTTVDPTTNINQTSAFFALTLWDQLVLAQGGSKPLENNPPIKGCLYGLNKKTGKILYEKCIQNTPLGGGASVANNTIYVGVGYRFRREATDGVLALRLPPNP